MQKNCTLPHLKKQLRNSMTSGAGGRGVAVIDQFAMI